MKKIIYKNIILIIVFFLLPWTYFENRDIWNYKISANSLIYFILLGAVYLLYANIKSAIKSKGRERVVSIIFIIPPAFVILYFILGYIAFSRYSILG